MSMGSETINWIKLSVTALKQKFLVGCECHTWLNPFRRNGGTNLNRGGGTTKNGHSIIQYLRIELQRAPKA